MWVPGPRCRPLHLLVGGRAQSGPPLRAPGTTGWRRSGGRDGQGESPEPGPRGGGRGWGVSREEPLRGFGGACCRDPPSTRCCARHCQAGDPLAPRSVRAVPFLQEVPARQRPDAVDAGGPRAGPAREQTDETRVGRGNSGPPEGFPAGRKSRHFPRGCLGSRTPVHRPRVSPRKPRPAALPDGHQLALAEPAQDKPLSPADLGVGKRQTSGWQRSCPRGARRPAGGSGGSASCPTLEACDTNRPLGLPSVKREGWAGPARSLNSGDSGHTWNSPRGAVLGLATAPVSRGVPWGRLRPRPSSAGRRGGACP